MNTTQTDSEIPEQPSIKSYRRGCLFSIKRVLKYFAIVLIVLALIGVVYQNVATQRDKDKYAPRGHLYTVNGHQMHMICMGEGSPAVILQAGGAAESLWWYWVQNQLVEHTQVCAFDRPGHGWSDSVSGQRDAQTINAELHALLDQAGIPAPYVMVGHSLGAIYTRVYAAQYPDEIAGIVMVDSAAVTLDDPFENQREFNEWTLPRVPLQALVWLGYRTGLARLIAPGAFKSWGYPSSIVPEMSALQAPNHVFDADYAEAVPGMQGTVNQAAAVEDLGDLPMVLLWASGSPVAGEHFRTHREEITTLSSNSATRFVEGAGHGSILGNEQYAMQVTNAILDVIEVVETGDRLTP